MNSESIKSLIDKVADKKIDVFEAMLGLRSLRINSQVHENTNENERVGLKNKRANIYSYGEDYLKDHTVNDDRVIIGVTYGCLAINEFFNLYPNESNVRISKLLFVEPVRLNVDEQVEIEVKADLDKMGEEVPFTVFFRHIDSSGQRVAATGSIAKQTPFQLSIDVDEIIKNSKKLNDISFIYETSNIVRLGESFRIISEIYFFNQDVVLARVELKSESEKDNRNYVLHPLFINSAFISLNTLFRDKHVDGDYIPFGVKDIKFTKDLCLRNTCWILVKLTRFSKDIILFDADIANDSGTIVAKLYGCSLKRVESKKTTPETGNLAAGSGNGKHNPDQNSQRTSQQYVIQKIRDIIPENRESIDLDINIMEFGLNSSQLTDLANKIAEEKNIDLYPTIFFEYPSVQEISDYFDENYGEKFLQLDEANGLNVNNLKKNKMAQVIAESNLFETGDVDKSEDRQQDVAIIGVNGVFPKSDNLDEFWEKIIGKEDFIEEVPTDHWDYRPWYDTKTDVPNKTYCKWGSFVSNVDKFDAEFFNISPKEAKWMDPQLRLLLQSVYASGEDAGYIHRLRGSDTGVFIGVCFHDYTDKIYELGLPIDPYSGTGNAQTVLANRISYNFDFNGPSLAVDTACSSSLFALHYACLALKNKECELAFVGGANLLLSSSHYRYFSSIGALSKTGRCHTFDAAADGYVPGECVGTILIKPLAQAERDNDNIYAIVKGTAALHGGYTPSLTAPSVAGEENVILKAWEKAGVEPDTITYIEAHGTGTKLGDPIEISSLNKLFNRLTDKKHFCAVGSIKANIGHTEGAAGIAGIIKVLLQLRHKTIPTLPKLKKINPYIKLDNSALYINEENIYWEALPNLPRRAGVSSFGFSGAYAHVVIEEYTRKTIDNDFDSLDEKSPAIIVLSAKSYEQLRRRVKLLVAKLSDKKALEEASDVIDIVDIAYTLQVGRQAMEERLGIVVESVVQLRQKLREFLEGYSQSESMLYNRVDTKKDSLANIDEPLKNGRYKEIMSLWVQGYAIDWPQLYRHRQGRIIRLPTYPFNLERYWLDAPSNVEEKGIGERTSPNGPIAAIHCLLHKNTSTLFENKYTTVFYGEEHFLTDHLVNDLKMLPGVVYLEMARAAATCATTGSVDETEFICVTLKNVTWVEPIVIEKASSTTKSTHVHTVVKPSKQNEVEFEIYTQFHKSKDVSKSTRNVHCLGYAALAPVANESKLDVEKLQRQCNKGRLDSDRCYDFFKRMGIEYGASLKALEYILIGQDIAVSKLTLPKVINDSLKTYLMHPSLLDAALQSTLGLLFDENNANFLSASKPILPFEIQRLDVFLPCAEHMWAVAKRNSTLFENKNIRCFDIDLCNSDGVVSVSIKGLVSRVFGDRLSPHVEAGPQVLLWQPQWRQKNIDYSQSTVVYDRRIVFLCEAPEALSVYADELKNRGEIDIVFLGTLKPSTESDSIDSRFYRYLSTIFSHLKVVMAGKTNEALLIQIAYFSNAKNEQVTNSLNAHLESSLFCAFDGLLKSASLEYPKVSGQIIEFQNLQNYQDLFAVLRNESGVGTQQRVSYRDGNRWVLNWQQLQTDRQPDAVNKKSLPWKDKGVYLITGGLGGLGLILSREIAIRCQGVNLILVGRSALDDTKEAQLEQLRSLGAKVEYYQLDISTSRVVNSFIEKVVAKLGQLNGIIHCAGVVRDNFIINKNESELVAVAAAKVSGVLNLDLATRAIALDFFYMCSSISSCFGSLGQCDYATANAFMDAYAGYRNRLAAAGERSGNTMSISWPLWKRGGMRIDDELVEMHRTNSGLEPMESNVGIQTLYHCTAQAVDHVLVTYGATDKIRNKLMGITQPVISKEKQEVFDIQKKSAISHSNNNKIAEKTIDYIKGLFAEVSEFPLDGINVHQSLENYGINSIMVIKLTAALEKDFGPLSKTLFFEFQSLAELGDYFINSHRARLLQLFGIENVVASKITSEEHSLANAPTDNDLSYDNPIRINDFDKLNESSEKAGNLKDDIVIVGLAGRYAKSTNMKEFWRNLCEGKSCITEIPKLRWDNELYFDQNKSAPGKIYSKWGGFLDGVDEFDPMFFNISPREAEFMDPQERLFLQCACETLEDAGYTRDSLGLNTADGADFTVGVYVGVMYEEYQLYGVEETIKGRPMALSGNPSSVANRVSYFCNFGGPSLAVDSMCSSSLTAIHLACMGIRNADCDFALAGGVNVSVHYNKYLMLSQGNFLSSKGRCESFGSGGDGYVPGEGVGAILLKRYSKAIEDRDHIYGIIRASAINHGGKSNGYSVPNPKAQSKVIELALKRAGVNPRELSYLEAHGTGTSLGDPIEISALNKVFRNFTKDNQFCAIGSVKSNIGHCESAAGIAGISKVLLQLKYRKLAPSLHSSVLNPNIDFNNSPFYVQQELKSWDSPEGETGAVRGQKPRFAAVSAFGAGGSNAHIVIEEYIIEKESIRNRSALGAGSPVGEDNQVMIVLSAKNEERLMEYATRLLAEVRDSSFDDLELVNLAYTLQIGREPMNERLALLASSINELEKKLGMLLEGKKAIENLFRGRVATDSELLSLFESDEDMNSTVVAWLRKKKYKNIMKLWVRGIDVEWNNLYTDHKPSRISLPTYPYLRNSYWAVKIEKAGLDDEISSLHSIANDLTPESINSETREYQNQIEKPSDISLLPLDEQAEALVHNNELEFTTETNSDWVGATSDQEPYISSIQADTDKTETAITRELIESLAVALHMKQEDITMDSNFLELGVDSIIGIEWIQWLNKQYELGLTVAKIYETPIVKDFSNYIYTALHDLDSQVDAAKSDNIYSLRAVLDQVESGQIDIDSAIRLIS